MLMRARDPALAERRGLARGTLIDGPTFRHDSFTVRMRRLTPTAMGSVAIALSLVAARLHVRRRHAGRGVCTDRLVFTSRTFWTPGRRTERAVGAKVGAEPAIQVHRGRPEAVRAYASWKHESLGYRGVSAQTTSM